MCGVLDEIFTFGIQTGMYGIIYVYTTGQNFTEVLPGTHGDGAMK